MSDEWIYAVLAVIWGISAVSVASVLSVLTMGFIRSQARRGVSGLSSEPSSPELIALSLCASALAGEVVLLQLFTRNSTPLVLRMVGSIVSAVCVWQLYRKRTTRVETAAVVELISLYYSAYLVRASVVEALKDVAPSITQPRLAHALQLAVDAFYSGGTLAESLERLGQNARHPLCVQFVSVLKGAERLSATAVTESLRLLLERAERQRTFYGQRLKGTMELVAAVLMLLILTFLASNVLHRFYPAAVSSLHTAQSGVSVLEP